MDSGTLGLGKTTYNREDAEEDLGEDLEVEKPSVSVTSSHWNYLRR